MTINTNLKPKMSLMQANKIKASDNGSSHLWKLNYTLTVEHDKCCENSIPALSKSFPNITLFVQYDVCCNMDSRV